MTTTDNNGDDLVVTDNPNRVTVSDGDGYAQNMSIEEQYEALKRDGIVSDDDEGAQGGATSGPDQDDSLPSNAGPEKFRDPETGEIDTEALLKSYKELEAKQSSRDRTDDEDGQVEQVADVSPEERQAAEDATTKAGLDLGEVSAEYWENDGLTEETYGKLEAAGYPKDMVDTYIDGLLSKSGNTVQAAYDITGDAETYGDMTEWAADNLTDAELAAYNNAVESGNKEQTLLAVEGLYSRYYMATADDEPEEQINRKGGNSDAGDSYQSMDEYMEDMNDPRYDSNETYRNAVIRKLNRSDIM